MIKIQNTIDVDDNEETTSLVYVVIEFILVIIIIKNIEPLYVEVDAYYAIYRSKESWFVPNQAEMINVDMEFVALDKIGEKNTDQQKIIVNYIS